MALNPSNSVFIVVAFEGPDLYSFAGGLASRITNLTDALVENGFTVHQFFVGDPQLPGREELKDGKLVLHRWCQWLSREYPGGVYDGEEEKVRDFTGSLPLYLLSEILLPAVEDDKTVVVLGEEWHTAAFMYTLSDLLYYTGIRNKSILFWNANNTYGFERIDWTRLSFTTTITTVSKYMKHIIQEMGYTPLVIPNGIPHNLLNHNDSTAVGELKSGIHADLTLSKVARWHPDKGWEPAFRAIGTLKKSGIRAVLLGRGSSGAYGFTQASTPLMMDVKMTDALLDYNPAECYRMALSGNNFRPYLDAIRRAGDSDIINLLFPVPPSFLQVLYEASDVVLANSIHEPFGLVGLEAMAAGAIVFCGCTGEDYASHMYNAIVLDTFTPEEIHFYVDYLRMHPERRQAMSAAAQTTASQWTWDEVLKRLLCKLEYQARLQKIEMEEENKERDTAETAADR